MRKAYPGQGRFVVVDGLDGIGKGVALEAMKGYREGKGSRVLDLHEFWKNRGVHPDFDCCDPADPSYLRLDDFDVMISAEPTFVGVGKYIRGEVTAKNGRDYSARATADMYALDRLILYKRVVLPALGSGIDIVQSRSVSTSLVYQSMQKLAEGEEPLTMEEIMAIEGNSFALDHAPDALIIPTVKDVDEVIRRLEGREKEDNCEFENPRFQGEIKPLYEGERLRQIFEERGTEVMYLDAGVSIEHSREQAVEMYERILMEVQK